MAQVRAKKCYNFKFKQAVIKHVEEKSHREVAREYLVDETAASIYYFFI